MAIGEPLGGPRADSPDRPGTPPRIRVVLWLALGLLLTGGVTAWAVRGPAILLELTTAAAGLLCL